MVTLAHFFKMCTGVYYVCIYIHVNTQTLCVCVYVCVCVCVCVCVSIHPSVHPYTFFLQEGGGKMADFGYRK